MGICGEYDVLDFQIICIRESWSAIPPAAFVFFLCLANLPVPRTAGRVLEPLCSTLKNFLVLHEAEALGLGPESGCGTQEEGKPTDMPNFVPLWRTVVLSFVAILESFIWISYGAYEAYDGEAVIWRNFFPFLIASSWTYAAIRPITHPTATPPYDLFTLYLLLFVGSLLQIGGFIFDYGVFGIPFPSTVVLVRQVGTMVAILVLLSIIVRMPVAIPSSKVDRNEIGRTITMEDYTPLWNWITFSWIYPIVHLGRYTTLKETDVWNLSPTIQSLPLFTKFSTIQSSTLLRKLFVANSLDIILDFVLTLVGVLFNYSGPFFLKRLLDAIGSENPTSASRAKAYIYAFVSFACYLGKVEVDVQHLWYGRRASTRVRSELMAAVYDKALRRRDYSGIVDKEKKGNKEITSNEAKKDSKSKKKDKEKSQKEKNATADDPRAGADVGKIVNLMSGDADRISRMVSGAYFIYGAPFEIIVNGVFLYQLLGWSAFVGFVVLIICWPLNNYLARRRARIQKGVSAARDKRMGALNELIGAVKFIKFFAWEDKWIQRVLDARAFELKWLVKSRINSILFHFLWVSAPILVSVISFFTYVMLGHELTVSVAFTALILFSMIRSPLNVIPSCIVELMQTGVALDRISVFLAEEEVTDQVSSLKKDNTVPLLAGEDHEGLGLENATLRWNAVLESNKEAMPKDPDRSTLIPIPSDDDRASRTADSSISNNEDHIFELLDVSVKFPERQLTVVTGPTGSGKTALLMALLGELTLLDGRIIMSKDTTRVDENGLMFSISYAAQTPWLRHQSVKDNILFGYPFDQARYDAVLEACALLPDLDILEDGDATEIGAKGVSLSGGQKARVALARAVYARTRYILLDDPLSAVDSHTSRHLYERLLCGPLLTNRTVVLVTHHVDLVLPGAHYLVRMLDGRIDTQGAVADLQAQGILEGIERSAATDADNVVLEETLGDNTPTPDKKPRKLIKDEHRETGGVDWSVYKVYLRASSYWTWVTLALLIVVSELLNVGEKLWIMTWGDAYRTKFGSVLSIFRSFVSLEHEIPMDGRFSYHSYVYPVLTKLSFGVDWPKAADHPLFYVGVYAAIGFASALASIISAAVQYTGALRASRILFKQLLVKVVRATFRFHDTTPQGRMLNRFGKDIEIIDSTLASSLQAVNSSLANFIASIVTIAVVFPYFFVPAFVIGYGYRELAIGYLNTGRDLRRMESNSRSPIFSDFEELLAGIVTIRAFSAERRFLNNLHVKVDAMTKMWYTFWMTNRWLLLHFDILGSVATLVTTLISISFLSSAGLAALCITSAMDFTGSVYWACRFWTSLELDLNSVERVIEYLNLPQEPPAVIENNRVPAYWPSSSNNDSLIVVENLEVKYAPELPAVLHGVSLTLKAGERIGLLGRTGSGKSTLAMSILRFVDPTNGHIIIDGIDISTIGVHDLRSRLTFIPQDASLFSGTLRDNLDPFGDHTDAECIEVLQRVQIITDSTSTSGRTSKEPSAPSSRAPSQAPSIINGLEGTISQSSSTALTDVDTKPSHSLESKVSAGGNNFSQGQRQLIAMARALLRHSSIIVLDEATSSIDFATDAKIQATIREEFTGSLLLTVAHRLRTVIDYDRLVVLDKGQIVEFDTPWNLIMKEGGIFRDMCLKSGTFGELEAAAKGKPELHCSSSTQLPDQVPATSPAID